MTYAESAEGIVISKERAVHEIIENHGLDHQSVNDFFSEYGNSSTYAASDVLSFLGY